MQIITKILIAKIKKDFFPKKIQEFHKIMTNFYIKLKNYFLFLHKRKMFLHKFANVSETVQILFCFGRIPLYVIYNFLMIIFYKQ